MSNTDPHNLDEFAELSANLQKLPPPPAPSARMRERFTALLAAEKQAAETAAPANVIPAARHFRAGLFSQIVTAAAMLVIGLLVGAHYLAPRPTTPTPAEIELAALRARVDGMDRLLAASLLQQNNTGERFQTVLALRHEKTPDRHRLADLVAMLAFEPSPNVRLSVLDALLPHAEEPLVRAGVLAALQRENAPTVQSAMIGLLADARATAAKTVLAKLGDNDTADPLVRDTARRALDFLEKNTYDPPPKSILL